MLCDGLWFIRHGDMRLQWYKHEQRRSLMNGVVHVVLEKVLDVCDVSAGLLFLYGAA